MVVVIDFFVYIWVCLPRVIASHALYDYGSLLNTQYHCIYICTNVFICKIIFLILIVRLAPFFAISPLTDTAAENIFTTISAKHPNASVMSLCFKDDIFETLRIL